MDKDRSISISLAALCGVLFSQFCRYLGISKYAIPLFLLASIVAIIYLLCKQANQ